MYNASGFRASIVGKLLICAPNLKKVFLFSTSLVLFFKSYKGYKFEGDSWMVEAQAKKNG